jgi:hypothetical protein
MRLIKKAMSSTVANLIRNHLRLVWLQRQEPGTARSADYDDSSLQFAQNAVWPQAKCRRQPPVRTLTARWTFLNGSSSGVCWRRRAHSWQRTFRGSTGSAPLFPS